MTIEIDPGRPSPASLLRRILLKLAIGGHVAIPILQKLPQRRR